MLRLVIVDDEEIIRTALSKMIDFNTIGYELIATAKNGMEAYDIICDEYPDVIITDIRMPVLDGLALIERAHKSDSSIDFILLSGFAEFEYAKQAMHFGVKHYLLKPTDKQELIHALLQIAKAREKDILIQQEKQQNILSDLRFPLEKGFIIEALQHPDISDTFDKYQNLLRLPESCTCACICSFVEEIYLTGFLEDIHKILQQNYLPLYFPITYVKNSAILIFPADSLSIQEQIRSQICALSYPDQSVDFDVSFLHCTEKKILFEELLHKISRYSRILMIDSSLCIHEISNSLTTPWQIEKLGAAICQAEEDCDIDKILATTFSSSSLDLETAKNLALSTYLWLNSPEDITTVDTACDFFRKVYSCNNTHAIYELLKVLSFQKSPQTAQPNRSNVGLLKAYVSQHLDEENLSLKWLAENYLFVNVRYLSKQFVKEEGERFSDYLNRQRMEEAKKLLILYNNDNIKDIAKQIGFGNNPRYFSQVFKRYTGYTPSTFLEEIQSKR